MIEGAPLCGRRVALALNPRKTNTTISTHERRSVLSVRLFVTHWRYGKIHDGENNVMMSVLLEEGGVPGSFSTRVVSRKLSTQIFLSLVTGVQ